MKTIRRITINSLSLLISEAVSRFLRFVLVIYAARFLGDSNYGKFSFAFAFCGLFIIIADMGISQLFVREVARNRGDVKRYIGNSLVIKLALAVLTFFIIGLTINLTHKSSDVVFVVYIIGISMILDSLAGLFYSVFQAFELMKFNAYILIFGGFVNTVLGLLVLHFGYGFIELSWTYVVASILTCSLCYVVTVKRFTKVEFTFEFGFIKHLLREGLPFGVIFLFATLYSLIDTVMLSFMKGDEVVGWYSAAYKLIFAILFLPNGFMRAIFPAFSVYYKSSLDLLAEACEKAVMVMLYLGLSIATVVTLIAPRIVVLIYGSEYVNSGLPMQILVWTTALIFVTTVLSHTARSMDRPGFTAKVVIGGATLNVLLNFILIPRFSEVGAAVATVLTECFSLAVHSWFIFRYLFRIPFHIVVPKALVANLAMGIFLYFYRDANLVIVLPIALVINVAMFFATKYFSNQDMKFFLESLRRETSEATLA